MRLNDFAESISPIYLPCWCHAPSWSFSLCTNQMNFLVKFITTVGKNLSTGESTFPTFFNWIWYYKRKWCGLDTRARIAHLTQPTFTHSIRKTLPLATRYYSSNRLQWRIVAMLMLAASVFHWRTIIVHQLLWRTDMLLRYVFRLWGNTRKISSLHSEPY